MFGRPVARSVVLWAGVGTALVLSGISGASPSKLPHGWWKGTIVVQERWDLIRAYSSGTVSLQGSATLRIDRSERASAFYELEYRQEARWRDVPPYPGYEGCRGKLAQRVTATLKERRPFLSFVRHWDPQGASFRIFPPEKLPPAVGQIYDDCVTGAARDSDVKLPYTDFEFVSKEPDSVRRRHGSTVRTGVDEIYPVFVEYLPNERVPAGAVNKQTITWDLRLVPVEIAAPKAPKAPSAEPVLIGKPTLSRPKPSAVLVEATVKQGGAPVRASAATCEGGFPSDPSYEKKTAHYVFRYLGTIKCGYVFNNAKYRGEILAGIITVRAGAAKATRRFSVRIGDGTSLNSPVGAVIVTGKRK